MYVHYYSISFKKCQTLSMQHFILLIKQKLKELENESIRLENHISHLKEQKADILAEIVEAER